MSKWARIDNGTVAEITDIDPAGRFHPSLVWVGCGNDVQPGWTYDGEKFAPPVPVELEQYVPQKVTRRQGRLALLETGYLEQVETMISAIADPVERRSAEIEYEADTWERSNEFLQQMWAQLGGTPEELDDLFVLAATK